MKIFTWSAPRWKFSRTPRRISSTPSNAASARPWPLLAVMPRVPQSSRGPGITPPSIASRTSRSRKFSSDITRMVVVPAKRSRRRFAVARSAWGTGALAQLADLIAHAGHDRDVAVRVDQAGHHEAVAEVDDLGAGRSGRRRRGADGRDAAAVARARPRRGSGSAPVPSNRVPQRTAEGHAREPTPCTSVYSNTVRPLTGCTGRLLGWCITLENVATCALDAETGVFKTSHRTPSVHGGVVSEPSYR